MTNDEWLGSVCGVTIAGLVRQIDEANERIGTLTHERDKALLELEGVRIARDTLQSKIAYANRIGW